MGGGSSTQIKQQSNNDNKDNKQNLKKSRAKNTPSKNNSPQNSPRNKDLLMDKINEDRSKIEQNKSKQNSKGSPLNSGRKGQNQQLNFDLINQSIAESKRQKLGNMFLQPVGQYSLDIQLLNLRQRKSQPKLLQKNARYQAILMWSFDTKKGNWNFQLKQKDNYAAEFILNTNGDLLDGNANIWRAISPVNTNKNRTKVGNFNCESYYQKIDQKINQSMNSIKSIDDFDKNQVFFNWNEKHINRPIDFPIYANKNNKKGSQKQPQKVQLQYVEISRYFLGANIWECSYYVQQRNKQLTVWMISKTNSDQNKRLVQNLRKDSQQRKIQYIKYMHSQIAVY